jgi:hypothetical protein
MYLRIISQKDDEKLEDNREDIGRIHVYLR